VHGIQIWKKKKKTTSSFPGHFCFHHLGPHVLPEASVTSSGAAGIGAAGMVEREAEAEAEEPEENAAMRPSEASWYLPALL
jgi:hypothetical protein